MSWICSSNWLHMLLVPLLTLSFISSIQCHAMTSTTCDPIFTLSLITRDKIQSHPCQHFAFSLPSASSFAGNSSSIEVNSVLYCMLQMSLLTIVYKWSQSVSGFSLTQIPKIHEKESDAALNLYSYHLPLRHHPRLWESYEHYEVSIGSIQYLLKNIKYTIIIKYTGIIITDAMISWNVLGYEEEEDYKNCCQYKSVGQHRWGRLWSWWWWMTINTASDKLSEHKIIKRIYIACAVTYWLPTTAGSKWNQSLD